MIHNPQKFAVITGASGGIGHALVQRLASDGWCLHLCDVNKDRLESMQQDLPENITSICESFLDSPKACELALRDVPDSVDALVHLAENSFTTGAVFDLSGGRATCLLYTSPSPRD